MGTPRSLLSVAVLCFTAFQLCASDLQILLTSGFGGFCSLGAITPVQVELRNPGPLEISGRLEISQPGSEFLEAPELTYAESTRIPPGGRLLIETAFRPLTDSYPLEARFLQSGSSEPLTAETDLKATAAGVVLALSRRRSFDFLQGELPGTAVVYPHYERLPAALSAYEAVRLLIIDDQSLPDRHAVRAAADWVSTGGELWLNTRVHDLVGNPLVAALGLDPAELTEEPWTPIPVGAGRVVLYGDFPADWKIEERTAAGRAAMNASASLLQTAREALIRPEPGRLHPVLGRLERDLPLFHIPASALIALAATAGISLLVRRSGPRLTLLLAGGLLLSILSLLYLAPFLDRGTETELPQLISRGGEAALAVRYRAYVKRSPKEIAPELSSGTAELFELFDPGIAGRHAGRGILNPQETAPWRPFLRAYIEAGTAPLRLERDSSGLLLVNAGEERAGQILLIDGNGVRALPDLPPTGRLQLTLPGAVDHDRLSIPREARHLADLISRRDGVQAFVSAVLEATDTRLLIEVSR